MLIAAGIGRNGSPCLLPARSRPACRLSTLPTPTRILLRSHELRKSHGTWAAPDRSPFSKAPSPSVRIEQGRLATPDSLSSHLPMPAVPIVFPVHIGRLSHRREKLPSAKSTLSH